MRLKMANRGSGTVYHQKLLKKKAAFFWTSRQALEFHTWRMSTAEIICLEAHLNVDICRSSLATTLHETEMCFCYLKRARSWQAQRAQLAHTSDAGLVLMWSALFIWWISKVLQNKQLTIHYVVLLASPASVCLYLWWKNKSRTIHNTAKVKLKYCIYLWPAVDNHTFSMFIFHIAVFLRNY